MKPHRCSSTIYHSKLLADGKETGKEATASEATGWIYEFWELEHYKDTKGTEIKYSVVEVPVDGYTSEVEGFNITIHTLQKNQHQVNQTNQENQDKNLNF